MDYFMDKNPDLKLHDQPIEQIETSSPRGTSSFNRHPTSF